MISATRDCVHRIAATTAFLCFSLLAFTEPQLIRLRNEVISTEKGAAKAADQAKLTPQEGLVLIQFTGPVQAPWVAQLKALGITVVHYVPDHAFIARAQKVRLADIDQLPFVQWTGPFRPEYKIHGRLARPTVLNGNSDVEVSVLLAPDATPQQVGAARGSMKRVMSDSKLKIGRIWRGTVAPAGLRGLTQSDAVLWIEPAPKIKLYDETASKIVGGDSGGHATQVQALGYDGSGVVVAVADSGLHEGDIDAMHPDLSGRVDKLFFYGQLTDASDEHGHGTHVAGIIAGNGATGELDDYGALWGLGVAPGAHIVAQRIFDGDGAYEAPPSYLDLTSDAIGAGADIGSNSWGDDTQGRYDISAMEFDALVRDGDGQGHQYILEFSAGNAGAGVQTIGSPAVGKNVIATGASQNDRLDYFLYADGIDAMADFSSRGPAEDGRIKPDLVAPGTWISSLRSPVGNDEFAWGDISFYYMFEGGTSQAGPHASGAAAVFVQYYRDTHTNATPSPALVKAALINSATDMDDSVETGPVPNNDEGWGRVDLTQLIGSDRTYDFVDQSITLSTGQQYERHIVLADESLPLFVTLAYTDVPAFPGAVPALVNDLDLEVVAPDGQVFRGNQFMDGESLPDSPSADNLNNVECVFIGVPIAGQYIVRVRARNVPQDARPDTIAVDQDFALVTSGSLPPAGTGFVFFDRRAYTVPGTINVKVVDSDLQGQGSVSVTVTSTSQPSGVALNLLPNGIPGTFTGSVTTVTTTTANRLRISHGDVIQTTYFDGSSGVMRTATAHGDLLPPVISGVGTSNSFGKTVVFWQTDEPASSIVRFSTNTSLNLGMTNRLFSQSHALSLNDLVPGNTYSYLVVSEDEAGNRTTNNNGGAFFTFVAAQAPTILLVDNYQSDGFDFGPDIPLSVYTDPLNQIGASYDIWSIVGGRPSPTVADLRPYRVVIWRVSDNVFINNTLSAAEIAAVQQYVEGGGSLFMSSMEQLSRLSAGFKADVLQVASFGEDATAPSAVGIPGNVITGGGISLPLDYSNYQTESYELFGVPDDVSDTMVISTNGFPILLENSGEIVGVASPKIGSDRLGRVVYLSFPLDAISATAPAPNNRAAVLQRILNFLAPGQEGIGSLALDNTEYTVPSLAIVEVGDSDLAGTGQVTVTVNSTSEPAGRTITLSEIGRFGIFRSTMAIVSSHGSNPSGELVAKNGDTISAIYFDASRGSSVTFTARVETVPPQITGTAVEPGYVDAALTWETDEPADALVQYGESPLLGRTAYVPTLDFVHEVDLQGLQPDHLYYYQVVSRDNAGNVTMDDNNGQLYTFRTLVPYSPPWSDDLEHGGEAEWFVYTTEDSEREWQYGVPNNGVAPHSESHVWGSNLNGQPMGFVESYLISPPIFLGSGNSATLKFWQNYEFFESDSDVIHLGEIAIITNMLVQPVTLDILENDASGDWQEAEYDLTPYMGNLVYIVWHYVFFTVDDAARPGWVIDDISVTSSNVVAGTLRITNNIAQASFSVSGPLTFKSQGNSYINTNAPTGQYVVVYTNVPYYNTPPSQTNTLQPAGTVVFTGNYTFADANTNGISDQWEQAYFGGVSPARNQFADTDGDGMSDQAEFLAGTDPTNATSALKFTRPVPQNTGVTRLDWPVVKGRSYRIVGSTSLTTWTPLSDWMRANGSILSFTAPDTNLWQFFKVEVSP